MPRLFRRPTRLFVSFAGDDGGEDPASALSALLDSDSDAAPSPSSSSWQAAARSSSRRHRRVRSSPCLAGERPQPRKLVKEPGGPARPSFSVELGDGDEQAGAGARHGAGVVRWGVERLRLLYARGTK